MVESDGGFGVLLDERNLRVPGGALFVAPTRALAALCAAEWEAQGVDIIPKLMPVTQLAFAAIAQTPKRRQELVEFAARFGQTDLLCHRAETPEGLAKRQGEAGDPVVAWARDVLGIDLPVVTGVVAARVPPSTLDRIRNAALELDDFRLVAFSQAAGLSGSVLIAFALLHGRLQAPEAFAISTLDEHWSIEHWGEDAEHKARLERVRTEFQALGEFIAALP